MIDDDDKCIRKTLYNLRVFIKKYQLSLVVKESTFASRMRTIMVTIVMVMIVAAIK